MHPEGLGVFRELLHRARLHCGEDRYDCPARQVPEQAFDRHQVAHLPVVADADENGVPGPRERQREGEVVPHHWVILNSPT